MDGIKIIWSNNVGIVTINLLNECVCQNNMNIHYEEMVIKFKAFSQTFFGEFCGSTQTGDYQEDFLAIVELSHAEQEVII